MPMPLMSNPQANATANPLGALSSLGSMGKNAPTLSRHFVHLYGEFLQQFLGVIGKGWQDVLTPGWPL